MILLTSVTDYADVTSTIYLASRVIFIFNGLLAKFNACGWSTNIPRPLEKALTNNTPNTCIRTAVTRLPLQPQPILEL